MRGVVGVVFPVGVTVMVVRRVRVMVLVERIGIGGGGEMLGVEWVPGGFVWCLVRWRGDAGERIERVVMMVLIPSIGTGVCGGFIVPGSCDLKPDGLDMGLPMGRYMVETMVIQDVEFVSCAAWMVVSTGVCGGGVSGPIGMIGGGTRVDHGILLVELMGTAILPAVWFWSCSFAQDESSVGRL